MDEKENDGIKAPTKAGGALYLVDAAAWIFAAVAFSPLAVWLAKEVAGSRQLSDALVILASMGAVLALDNKIRLHRPRFSGRSMAVLALAYAACAAAPFCMWAAMPVGLLGLALFATSLAMSCFDSQRYAAAMGISFYVFLLLSLFLKAFDLPLRILAGEFSVWILHFINSSATLIAIEGYPPQIGIIVGLKRYLVATECNGFAIISSCAVLSVLLAAFARGAGILPRLLTVAASVFMAAVANALRIACIVSVAPLVGDKYYTPMHEAFGYFFFALTLLSVWILAKKMCNRRL